MADAAVEFLLGNLTDLLRYHIALITETKSQIESLQKDLDIFNAILKDSVKKRRKDNQTKLLMRNIRDVVYEVEDVIDAFVTQSAGREAKNAAQRVFTAAVDLHSFGKQIEEVKKKVEHARIEYANHKVDDQAKSAEKHKVRPPREKGLVGFEDETEKLIHRLNQETDDIDVISLIGMFGLGKTTLAWKVFNEPEFVPKFPVRIWLSISQDFSDKDIFISILQVFINIDEDIRQREAHELARIIADHLENVSFLIVMDDVWETADWDRLQVVLPEKNKKGKVLITSRNKDVGTYASKTRPLHELRFFNQKESWKLLRLEALHKLECHPDLKGSGKQIARDCQGLPLALVVIGGILATKYSADISAMRREWEEVSTRVSAHLHDNNNNLAARMKQFISLSYDQLPYHLRECFLYLAMFPEDYEIPVSKLIHMWIAEGFIQQDIYDPQLSLERRAEKYLEDLINRNLVRIEKFKADGKVKTCKIHDTLRDFCRTEAGIYNENFLQEIKFSKGAFVPPVSDLKKYRRLSIHSNCLDFITSKPVGPHVRSFVCFSKDEFTLNSKIIPDILKAFKLVRVLDVKPIKFSKITNNMYQLVHVRYIVLSFDSQILPEKFNQLWNIQTLIVNTTSSKFEVKADIWNMKRLRHFKTNVSATLPEPSYNSEHGAELQTLGIVSAKCCTAKLFDRARNLNKLVIGGKVASLLDGKIGSFDSLRKMENLEKLKLINSLSEGKLDGLPQHYQFPSNLKSLTLVSTSLDWSCMSILGFLAKLEVLKLKSRAVEGSTWEAVDGGFRRLEFLQIEQTNLSVWKASSHHYPRLKSLKLQSCEKLIEIPMGLAEIESFLMLDLYNCKLAAKSATKIAMEKKSTQDKSLAFKLIVYPPSE